MPDLVAALLLHNSMPSIFAGLSALQTLIPRLEEYMWNETRQGRRGTVAPHVGKQPRKSIDPDLYDHIFAEFKKHSYRSIEDTVDI